MNFVYDVHLILPDGGRKIDFVRKLANLVHGVVGRGVYLQNVEVARQRKFHTHFALAAGRAVLRVQAVDRTRKNLRHRSLARAARARKEVGVAYVARFNLIDQRLDDVVLTYDVAESVRTVSAIERSVCHREIITETKSVCKIFAREGARRMRRVSRRVRRKAKKRIKTPILHFSCIKKCVFALNKEYRRQKTAQ